MRQLKQPKRLCILLVLLSSGSQQLLAQYNTSFINYRNTRRSVSVNLDFEAGSNGLSAGLVNKLVWGGYISNDLKAESSKHLKNSNNFGLALNYGVDAFVKGTKNIDFLIGFKNQEVLNATFTRDFFNLMFYGNSMYRGQFANLSGSNVNALRFQEAKFGFMMHALDTVGKIGVSVSVLKGEQLFYVQTHEGSGLYTSQDGSNISFTTDFNMALSDTNKRGLKGFNGIGASADIFFETPYKSAIGKTCLLTVNANNLGFIHWWNNSVQYSSDSTFNFSGYTVKNIYDLKDSTISAIDADSLVRNLSNARTEDFNVNIPTNLVLINRIYFSDKFAGAVGFRYIFNANYKPYFFIEPEYKFKNLVLALHVGYGGYVKLNVGTSVTWNSKAWFLRIGSNSLQGYITPKAAFGQGLFFSLAKKLK